MTLLADCETDHTILVPNGFTLDGAGHKITAVDPAGGHFLGAVVMNAGLVANVKNVEDHGVRSRDVCDAGDDRLRGILFDNAAGTISNVNVHGVRQGLSRCQEGNAIQVRNSPGSTPRSVTIENSTVSDYQKNGITLTGLSTALSSATPSPATDRSTTSPRTASRSASVLPRSFAATPSPATTTRPRATPHAACSSSRPPA